MHHTIWYKTSKCYYLKGLGYKNLVCIFYCKTNMISCRRVNIQHFLIKQIPLLVPNNLNPRHVKVVHVTVFNRPCVTRDVLQAAFSIPYD